MTKQENPIKSDRLSNGYFKKGNTIGRMKKKGFTLTDLNKVVMAYEKTHDTPLLKHYINQLFQDNKLLDKFIDRNVPVKTINELTGKDGSPLTVTLKKVIYSQNEGKEENKGG